MGKAEYPTVIDLKLFLESAGFVLKDSLNLNDFILGAIGRWEQITGWHPFLASQKSAKRAFIFPHLRNQTRILELNGGLVKLDSLTLYSTRNNNRKILIPDQDFSLMPLNASSVEKAYEWIEFTNSSGSEFNRIEIIGQWGYGLFIPDDAWLAILKIAAHEVFMILNEARSGGLRRWSEGDVKEEFAIDPCRNLTNCWKDDIESIARNYRRFLIGV